MNRKDFLKMVMALPFSIFLKGGAMLPNSGQKYGDMLREIAQGDVSPPRMDEIQRKFNELWDIIQTRNIKQKLEQPEIYQPLWLSSPLRVFYAYLNTDTDIPVNAFTVVTFENSAGDKSLFNFYNSDKSKIAIDRNKYNVMFSGKIVWEANTTGDRIIRVNYYDNTDTLLGNVEISNQPTANTAGFAPAYPFFFLDEIRSFLPNVAYVKIDVFQNGASPLKLKDLWFAVSIA